MNYDFFTRLSAKFNHNINNIYDYSYLFDSLKMNPESFTVKEIDENNYHAITNDIDNEVVLEFHILGYDGEYNIGSVSYIYDNNCYQISCLEFSGNEMLVSLSLIDHEGIKFAEKIAIDENGHIDFDKAGILPDFEIDAKVFGLDQYNNTIFEFFKDVVLEYIKKQKGIVAVNPEDTRSRK